MLRTNVYIDAFNLYYGCLRNTSYRWLDISKLCTELLTKNDINKLKYFTALVTNRPDDATKAVRQQAYLRALGTIPNLAIIKGHYLTHKVLMPLVNPPATGPKSVRVFKTEEKGSDVNLATHLLLDAFKKDCEVAVVISNDSDLLEPIRVVKNDFKIRVGIINPQKRPSRVLLQEAMFFKSIWPSLLKRSQFPDVMRDTHGTFHKPSTW